MTTSLTTNIGDFDQTRTALATWLSQQPQFATYDFSADNGSNINVLLGLLSYNTYLNLFYHNMSVNETFIDTAVLRDSVVSRAKELNYTPRSFKSAEATVNITVSSTNLSRSSVVLPKGTIFTARIGDRSYTFSTDRTYVSTASTVSGAIINFIFTDVVLFEGYYLTETVSYVDGQYITIPNEQVDTSSISVVGVEDNGATAVPYNRAVNLYDVNPDSTVFFLQGAAGSKYQIGFGDNLFGRKPKLNSIVSIDYRISSGELPNGAQVFKAGQPIDGEAVISIETTVAAHAGAVFETIEEIRTNAPRHFSSQGNAVSGPDYRSLLKETFPEIIDVASYGGEDANPPQFGNVLLSVVVNGANFVPKSKIDQYTSFLRARSLMKPVFIEPEFVFVNVDTTVHYDITKTSINTDDIKTIVLDAILNYSNTNLNSFGKTLRYSRLSTAIDASHPAIVSNTTTIKLVRELGFADWQSASISKSFHTPVASVSSTRFYYQTNPCTIESSTDTSELFLVNSDTNAVIKTIGSLDRATGLVSISNIVPDDQTKPIGLYTNVNDTDIISAQNMILKIRDGDVTIRVERI
jgi:hypothetical protein